MDLWKWSRPFWGGVRRDGAVELGGHRSGPGATARPQSTAACRQGGRGQQSRGLSVGKRQAKAFGRVLAADRTAVAAIRERAAEAVRVGRLFGDIRGRGVPHLTHVINQIVVERT